MAPFGDHGAAVRKHLRVLLPFSCDTLRIPDELAGEIDAGEALVVAPSGGSAKFWPVEVGEDGDGAFLGRGWREFAAACGVRRGWLLVLRHRGRGVLTAKAFDDSLCLLREVGAPAAAEAITISKDASRRPQFISVLSQDTMEKMLLPAKFVVQCIPNEHLNSGISIVLGPLGKVCPIDLEINQLDVFFTGGWSQFLAFHGITKDNALLLRYEGNMVFTVKVFGANGCQNEFRHKDTGMQQSLQDIEKREEALNASIQRCKSKNALPSIEGQNRPKGSMIPLHMASVRSVYEIGAPSWIKKQINANTLEKELALSTAFCDAIGLREPCTITLKTSMDSTTSWQVHGIPSKNKSYRLRQGWRRFCRENTIGIGDVCTFNVVKTTTWHVVVTRCKEKINQFCYEAPSTPSKCRIKTNRSNSKGKKRLKGSRTSLNRTSKTKCVYEIGPPAWMKKEFNSSTIEKQFCLPLLLCEGIGLRKSCMITLKISTSSTMSWQARVVSYRHCNHLSGPGWRRFCRDNGIKAGDVCTFNIIETTVWHVVIAHQ